MDIKQVEIPETIKIDGFTYVETNFMIKTLQLEGLSLSKRTLTFWRYLRLIPSPRKVKLSGNRGTASYYPYFTVQLIETIRGMQTKGHSLTEIRSKLDEDMSNAINASQEPVLEEFKEAVVEAKATGLIPFITRKAEAKFAQQEAEYTRLSNELEELSAELKRLKQEAKEKGHSENEVKT